MRPKRGKRDDHPCCRAGETLTTIADRYGVSVFQLAESNAITDPARLVIGQTLCIQYPQTVHTVAMGESLPSIAQRYGVPVNQIFRNNPILRGNPEIYPGQTLVISFQEELGPPAFISGYAYPFVDKDLLRRTLPYLSFLIPFSYGFDAQGNLVDLDDGELISMARAKGIECLMHLSTLTGEGSFSNALSSAIFQNPTARANLIGNVLQTMQRKGYAGLDVDFEYVLPEDREGYIAFARELRDRLHPLGYPLVIALAPKTYAQPAGASLRGARLPRVGGAGRQGAADDLRMGIYLQRAPGGGPPAQRAASGGVRSDRDTQPARYFSASPTTATTGRCPMSRGRPAREPSPTCRRCSLRPTAALPSNTTRSRRPRIFSTITPRDSFTRFGLRTRAASRLSWI